jgi:hypothetical protein
MKLLSATLLAALAIGQVEAYPKFFTGMTWANFAWEVNPKEEDLAKKDMVLVDAFDASSDSIKRVCHFKIIRSVFLPCLLFICRILLLWSRFVCFVYVFSRLFILAVVRMP